MRIFVMLAVAATVVLAGYGISKAFFGRSSAPSMRSETPNTLSPHEIHLNYKAMEKLPVHDVKDAI
jgi:flagellar basal body-associated protein FliL